MLVNLALSCVCGVFVLQAVIKGLEDDTLPIACVWKVDNRSSSSNTGLSYAGTIAAIGGNCIIFVLATWYLHNRNQRFQRTVQIGGIVLMTAVAVAVAVRVIILSQAFGNPSVKLSDEGEKDWSFGQLLSLLLLILPLILVVEVYRGEVKLVDPAASAGRPFFSAGGGPGDDRGAKSFQPNLDLTSQTELIQR